MRRKGAEKNDALMPDLSAGVFRVSARNCLRRNSIPSHVSSSTKCRGAPGPDIQSTGITSFVLSDLQSARGRSFFAGV